MCDGTLRVVKKAKETKKKFKKKPKHKANETHCILNDNKIRANKNLLRQLVDIEQNSAVADCLRSYGIQASNVTLD